jgi:trans-2,3-dihydro-3-hydroxyanthranilate isomerase
LNTVNEIPFALYDSFATQQFAGNVAGVIVLDSPLPERIMQAVAAELGAPTTGFALATDPRAVGIRLFTPRQEIDACGHVSLAIAVELVARGVWMVDDDRVRMVQAETVAGPVPMRLTKGATGVRVYLSYSPRAVETAETHRDLIQTTLGVRPDGHLPIGIVETGLRHLVVGFASTEELAVLRLDDAAIRQLARTSGVDTICAFAQIRAALLRMRDLTAAIGAIEEAASGTTSSALAAYGVENGLLDGRSHVLIEQGVEMGRPSLIDVELESSEEGRVAWVGGEAIKTVTGAVLLAN